MAFKLRSGTSGMPQAGDTIRVRLTGTETLVTGLTSGGADPQALANPFVVPASGQFWGFEPPTDAHVDIYWDEGTRNLIADVNVRDTALDAVTGEAQLYTGFTDPANVTQSYNSTTRIVTLSGLGSLLYDGEVVLDVTAGHTSVAHADTAGSWFYFYNGTAFVWSQSPWVFGEAAMVVYVNYPTFAVRECHGLMDWESHRVLHARLGTYRVSGGDITITTGSAVTADKQPLVSATNVLDEDCPSLLAAISARGSYTHFYLLGTTPTWTTANTHIVPVSGGNIQYNQKVGESWQLTTISSNGRYHNVWMIGIPVTSDATSQAYRFVFVQGQANHATVVDARAATFDGLDLGTFATLAPEFVVMQKFIVRSTISSDGWSIEETARLEQTRSQSLISGGVITDHSLLTGRDAADQHPQSAITDLVTDLGGKQATLVSGTNIKTINSTSLLGEGNIVIEGGGVVEFPQNSQSVDYTLVLGDAGKMIFHPAADTAERTWTIPANASVAFPVGTVIALNLQTGSGLVVLSITSDTLRLPDGTTSTARTLRRNILYLLVKTAATEWLMTEESDVYISVNTYLAVAHTTTPFVTAYPWSSSGFGTKFTDPSTPPAGQGNGVAFSPAGTEIAVAQTTTPFVTAYPWSSSGFGTKFTDPGTPPASTGNGVAFSPSGTEIAVAHTTTPFVSAYPWSSSGFGTKFNNPGTLPASTGRGVAFSPSGTEIAVAHNTTPFVSAYPWSSSGFGTKFTDPITPPAGNCFGVAFSPSGTEIAVAHFASPNVAAYPWSSSGFGTKFTDPGTPPPDTGRGVAFSPAGTEIAVAHSTTPFVTAYPWSSSGFGTKFTDPGTPPAFTGNGVAFSPAGTEIAVAHNTTPFVTAYPWSSSGFGTKFADPGTLPASTGLGVAFTET